MFLLFYVKDFSTILEDEEENPLVLECKAESWQKAFEIAQKAQILNEGWRLAGIVKYNDRDYVGGFLEDLAIGEVPKIRMNDKPNSSSNCP